LPRIRCVIDYIDNETKNYPWYIRIERLFQRLDQIMAAMEHQGLVRNDRSVDCANGNIPGDVLAIKTEEQRDDQEVTDFPGIV